MSKERQKYYTFTIDFKTEEDRDEFKNYLHHLKTGKGIPIYQAALEMMELHKEVNKKKR